MADRSKAANSLDLDFVRKLEASRANLKRADLIMVVRYARPGLPLAWLENGKAKAGLVHIVMRHGGEFIESHCGPSAGLAQAGTDVPAPAYGPRTRPPSPTVLNLGTGFS
ncbi:hypothetical protein ACFYOD_17025 [Streptomyces sp. NPDC006703]|uniref:hypothetical protein n=1 Tax=Streptomyces sp. NPDC006703 TaxID=3364759 RepID=UPI00367F5E4B